jgi:hypothetical protein
MSLRYRKTQGYKYVVEAAYECELPELAGVRIVERWFSLLDGHLRIAAGYAWDGASGPTLDTASTMAASLVHDVLYQCIRAGLLGSEHRATADMILYRLMRSASTGNRAWIETRAAYYFIAVRLFGGSAVTRRSTEPQDHVYSA